MTVRVSSWSALLLCSLVTLSASALAVQAAEPEAKPTESKKAKPKSSADKPSAKDKAPAGKQKDKGSAAVKDGDDLLKACLSRIPKDGSAGQRMLAEQSCQREEKARASSGAARQF